METKEEIKQRVEPKPLGKVNIFRKILRKLPGFCSYCGKKYVGCHSENINFLCPLPQNGKCCPDGHEGYVDVFMLTYTSREIFDFVENPPSKEEIK